MVTLRTGKVRIERLEREREREREVSNRYNYGSRVHQERGELFEGDFKLVFSKQRVSPPSPQLNPVACSTTAAAGAPSGASRSPRRHCTLCAPSTTPCASRAPVGCRPYRSRYAPCLGTHRPRRPAVAATVTTTAAAVLLRSAGATSSSCRRDTTAGAVWPRPSGSVAGTKRSCYTVSSSGVLCRVYLSLFGIVVGKCRVKTWPYWRGWKHYASGYYRVSAEPLRSPA